MRLKFLGTRGEIDLRTRLHWMHTSIAVSYHGRSIMIDCGADWLDKVSGMCPAAIVLTHAHPDHAWGLENGAPCPVFATAQTWASLEDFPLPDRTTVLPRSPFRIGEITLEAFPVEHSIRAPAVGYRITAGRSSIFYVPDVVYINDLQAAFREIKAYVGDGASLRRPMVRRADGKLFGHAAVRTQFGWCQRQGVNRALITHCGSEIVGANPRAVRRDVRELGRERGIDADLAWDGRVVILP